MAIPISDPDLNPAESLRTRVAVGWAFVGVAILAALGTVSALAWLIAG